MARRKADDGKVITVDPDNGEPLMLGVDGGGGPADFSDPGDTNAHRKTEDFYFQMLGEDESGLGYVTVHYLPNGQGQSETSVLKCPSDKYTLDELTEEIRQRHAVRLHPGKEGDYRIRLYAKSQRGNNKIVGNRLVTLLAPEAPGGTALATLPAPVVDPVIAALLRDMREESRALQEKMMALMAEKKGRDPVDFLLAIAPIVTPLVGAWLARPKDDPMKALTAALALTGTIRDLRAENDAPTVQSDESAPWWAPALLQGLNGITAAMAARGALPAPAPVPGAVPGQAPVALTGGQPAHPLYPQISALVGVAHQADPDEVAMQVWRELPPEHRPILIPALTSATAFRDLVAIHPGVLDHAEWFMDLIAALREAAEAGNTADTFVAGGQADGAGSDRPDNHS